MTLTKKHLLTLFITVCLFGAAFVVANSYANLAGASAEPGVASTVATSSSVAVTATAKEVFATSTCLSRVISTASSTIRVTFSNFSNQTPTAFFGHVQAASTTVAYDSGLYGCGLLKVYSYEPSLITVSETR